MAARFFFPQTSTMLAPFDWYTVMSIGIAAAVVGAVVLIAWITGQWPARR